jgi:transcription initiation factor TFIIH subunit 2
MLEKDLRPTRYLLTIRYATEFVMEFFEQNPISQLGIVGMRDGLAVKVSSMSGNPNDHFTSLHDLRKHEAHGQPSLENALEMARASLFHAPTHGTREILLVFGALHTADPGDIHVTIANLVKDKIRTRVIGLAAQVAICAELVAKTNNGDPSNYSIVLNEQHFHELMMELTTPPVISSQSKSASSSLLMMGFPSRTVDAHPSLCACHSRPSREGYLCSRCSSKVCSLPSECPTCGLTLILSTHLARSYHHLFPLMNWEEVRWRDSWRSSQCFACGKAFPEVSGDQGSGEGEGLSGRYECTVCHRHFCVDCDVLAHEIVHNCPGCQGGGGETASAMAKKINVTVEGNGEGLNGIHGQMDAG